MFYYVRYTKRFEISSTLLQDSTTNMIVSIKIETNLKIYMVRPNDTYKQS